jgi:hypothetical protein
MSHVPWHPRRSRRRQLLIAGAGLGTAAAMLASGAVALARHADSWRDGFFSEVSVGEDRREVPVAEPAGVSAPPERAVDLAAAVQLGEIDRLGHLAPHTLRTRVRK